MVVKVVKCPICGDVVEFHLTKIIVEGKKFPVPCIFIHQIGEDNHAFIAYLDSDLSLCDVEVPEIITNKFE